MAAMDNGQSGNMSRSKGGGGPPMKGRRRLMRWGTGYHGKGGASEKEEGGVRRSRAGISRLGDRQWVLGSRDLL